jgi:GMP synthase (glutamine-hydrolysing)
VTAAAGPYGGAVEALVVRHVAFEDLGLLEPLLLERGYDIRYAEAGIDALPERAADLLVVLGGPIGVGDVAAYPFLADETALIRRTVDAGAPVLGICLGAQLTAAALGAEVTRGEVEIGFGPLSLAPEGEASPLGRVGDAPVLHWHGDTFAIPEGAVRLASTAACANQAFAIGDRVLGLQFHLEADPARLEQWLIGHSGELAQHGIDPRVLRDDARHLGPELAARGSAALGAWLDGLR